jgi:hypothetical protein
VNLTVDTGSYSLLIGSSSLPELVNTSTYEPSQSSTNSAQPDSWQCRDTPQLLVLHVSTLPKHSFLRLFRFYVSQFRIAIEPPNFFSLMRSLTRVRQCASASSSNQCLNLYGDGSYCCYGWNSDVMPQLPGSPRVSIGTSSYQGNQKPEQSQRLFSAG